MKILLVSYLYPNPEKPIAGSFVFEQALELAKRHEVHILTHSKAQWGLKSDYEENGLHIHRVPSDNALLFPLRIFARTLSLERLHHFDVIHAHFVGVITLMTGLAAKMKNRPFFITAYGLSLDPTDVSLLRRITIRLCFLLSKKIISVSRYTRTLCEHYAKGEKHEVITCGILPNKLKPTIPKVEFRKKMGIGNGPLFISVGGLVWRKGQDAIVRAMPLVLKKHPNATYLSIGRGQEEGALKKLASDLKVEKNVIFWPNWVSDEDLANFYNASDVFVLMSRTKGDAVEGFGIVYAEANAMGLAVIGGLGGGTPDAIDDGKSGFLIDPDDTKELAAKMTLLIENNTLRKKMGQHGKGFALKNHPWAVKMKALEKLYSQFV